MSEEDCATISRTLATGREILRQSGIPRDDAIIESRVLLQHVSGMTAEQVIGNPDAMVGKPAARDYLKLVHRRRDREPLAYILGEWEFYGRPFRVDENVLIPRPETELLVDLALEFASANGLTAKPRVCDLGTGSGALAVTLALEFDQSEVIASDISDDALTVAQSNAERHGVAGRIDFRNADITSDTIGDVLGRFDIVVANPPYIPTGRIDSVLEPEVSQWEPRLALDGGLDGLAVLGPMIERIPLLMRETGPSVAFIEIDCVSAVECQGRATREVPDAKVGIILDDAGLHRILAIERAA